MSPDRRRGLVRLGILLASIAALIAIGLNVVSGSSGGGQSESGQAAAARARPHGPARLTATTGRARLPVALHGEAVTPGSGSLLLIGGEDSAGSSDRVYRLDPATGRFTRDGSLAQPLHDAAAVTLGGGTLVFGGGNTSTLDLVQQLAPGGAAGTVGHLPDAVSDVSAVHLAGAAYVLGGFDGQRPSASVLQTTDGRSFTRVARLPTPVRYAAAATTGDKIYLFGGELADGSDTSEIQEYDLATERAVVAGHLPDATSHASAVSLGGTIYLLGGRVNGAASDRILRFDPARSAAVSAGRLPQPVFDGAAGTVGGRAYLLGGLGASAAPLDSVIELR
jgi:Kelch motif protein